MVLRVLPPWFENLKKRQVKSPKVYLQDSGLLHELLGLNDADAVAGHAKVGASFEGFAVEQVLAAFADADAYFWATHAGAELDLLLRHRGKRYGFECKLADAPRSTRLMRTALADLRLDHLWVLYPGEHTYALDDRNHGAAGGRSARFGRRSRRLAGDGSVNVRAISSFLPWLNDLVA